MKRFSPLRAVLALAALSLGAASTAHADFQAGTQGLVDVGRTTIDGSSLSNATVFTFGKLQTTESETGSFSSTPSSGLVMPLTTLNLANPTAFTFGTTDFGTFLTKGVTDLGASGSIRSFFIQGTFVSGTRFGTSMTVPATFYVSFTANTSTSGTSYSNSGTLSVPVASGPAAVPEPASMALLSLGLAGAGLIARRRRTR